jgi:hypothetical protein
MTKTAKAGTVYTDEHGTAWPIDCTCGGVIGAPCQVCNPDAVRPALEKLASDIADGCKEVS